MRVEKTQVDSQEISKTIQGWLEQRAQMAAEVQRREAEFMDNPLSTALEIDTGGEKWIVEERIAAINRKLPGLAQKWFDVKLAELGVAEEQLRGIYEAAKAEADRAWDGYYALYQHLPEVGLGAFLYQGYSIRVLPDEIARLRGELRGYWNSHLDMETIARRWARLEELITILSEFNAELLEKERALWAARAEQRKAELALQAVIDEKARLAIPSEWA